MSAFVIGFPGAVARQVASLLAGPKKIKVKLLTPPEHLEEAKKFIGQIDGDISILEGTEERIDFGLTGPDYTALADELSIILHLDLPGPPKRFSRRSNARTAAREILELGLLARQLTHIVVLSQLDVAGTFEGAFSERDLEQSQGFSDAFQENRFRAERIFRRFMDKLPITVARTGWVVGEGKGLCPIIELLLAVEDPETLPVKSQRSRLFVIDVDTLASILCSIVLSPPSKSGGQTLHLVPEELPPLTTLLTSVRNFALDLAPPGFDLTTGARRMLRKNEWEDVWSARGFFKKQPYRIKLLTSSTRRTLQDQDLPMPTLEYALLKRLTSRTMAKMTDLKD